MFTHFPNLKVLLKRILGLEPCCDVIGNNKLWKIDTAMSKAFCNINKQYQVLEILDDGKSLPSNNSNPIRILK